jgi:RND family efflux transporter MFP subunit
VDAQSARCRVLKQRESLARPLQRHGHGPLGFAIRAVAARFAAVAVAWGCLAATAGNAQQGPAIVSVATVVQGEVSGGIRFVGTVEPLRRSVVGSAVDGRVIEMLVDEGDPVELDQPLARLRTATLEIQLAAAKAELELRQHELAELENGSRPEEIAQAEARQKGSQAAQENARLNLQRAETLFSQNRSVSQKELDLARAEAVETEQAYLAASAEYELVVAGPRVERIEQARARMNQQRELVAEIEDRIEKHTVRAPFAGSVIATSTEVGAWISQGDAVAEVIELDPVEVRVSVPETQIAKVVPGLNALVIVPALSSEPRTGQVARVIPQADIRSRTFPVLVRLPNPVGANGPELKAGMLADVVPELRVASEALLVPKDALVLGGPAPVVFVVDGDASSQQLTARPVPVQIGRAEGGSVEVRGQLLPGQRIVIEGNERLRPGQPIRITGLSSTAGRP